MQKPHKGALHIYRSKTGPSQKNQFLMEIIGDLRFICGSCLEEMEEPRVTSSGEIEIQPCECMGDRHSLSVTGPEFDGE